MVDIRATTEAHTDIADVLISMNGAHIADSLPRKESLSLSEIGDVIKLMTTTFEIRGHDFWITKVVVTSYKVTKYSNASDKVFKSRCHDFKSCSHEFKKSWSRV